MKYGLLGEKLGHSFSKILHEQIGNDSYELIEIEKEELEKVQHIKMACLEKMFV